MCVHNEITRFIQIGVYIFFSLGISQMESAKRLKLTQPAVSQAVRREIEYYNPFYFPYVTISPTYFPSRHLHSFIET